MTIGGIHGGELVSLKEDFVVLKVANNVEIKLSRSGIGHVAS